MFLQEKTNALHHKHQPTNSRIYYELDQEITKSAVVEGYKLKYFQFARDKVLHVNIYLNRE